MQPLVKLSTQYLIPLPNSSDDFIYGAANRSYCAIYAAKSGKESIVRFYRLLSDNTHEFIDEIVTDRIDEVYICGQIAWITKRSIANIVKVYLDSSLRCETLAFDGDPYHVTPKCNDLYYLKINGDDLWVKSVGGINIKLNLPGPFTERPLCELIVPDILDDHYWLPRLGRPCKFHVFDASGNRVAALSDRILTGYYMGTVGLNLVMCNNGMELYDYLSGDVIKTIALPLDFGCGVRFRSIEDGVLCDVRWWHGHTFLIEYSDLLA